MALIHKGLPSPAPAIPLSPRLSLDKWLDESCIVLLSKAASEPDRENDMALSEPWRAAGSVWGGGGISSGPGASSCPGSSARNAGTAIDGDSRNGKQGG